MSSLTNSLEALLQFLQQHAPEQASLFLPGLPESQIQEMINSLSLPCPQELIELYHWRNGIPSQPDRYCFPPEFYFLPLEEVVENYEENYRKPDTLQDLDTIRWDYGYAELKNVLLSFEIDDNHKMLPFMQPGEGYFHSVVVSTSNSYILLDHIKDFNPQVCFDSITNMMQTLLVAYQEGAYYLSEEGSWEVHSSTFREIWQQHNPLTFKQNLSLDEWLDESE